MTPPTLSDDVVYKCVWTADDSDIRHPIMTFGDVLESQMAHYIVMNGRVIVHTIAQTFLGLVGKDLFNILNALLFGILIWLCTFLATGRYHNRHRGSVRQAQESDSSSPKLKSTYVSVVLSAFVFFVFIPGFEDSFLWFVGSFNYLWTAVGVMMFLIYFYCNKKQKISVKSLLVCPFAVLAGWSHEGLTLPISFGLMVWVLGKGRNVLHNAALPGVICFVVGTAVCVFSPGTLNRASAVDQSLLNRILLGGYNMLAFVRVLWILLLVMIVAWWHKCDVLMNEFRHHYVLYAALLPAYGIVIVCGQTESRVCFHAEFIASLLLVSFVARLKLGRAARPFIVSACGIIAVITAVVSGFAVINMRNYKYQLSQQLDKNISVIRVRSLPQPRSLLVGKLVDRYVKPSVVFGFYSCYSGFDANDSNLRCAAAVYGREQMIYLPEDIVARLQADTAAYTRMEIDSKGDIGTLRIANERHVKAVKFILKPERIDSLPLYKRFVAYRGDTYELPESKFKTVDIGGRTYLFIALPLTNVLRRISKTQIILEAGPPDSSFPALVSNTDSKDRM